MYALYVTHNYRYMLCQNFNSMFDSFSLCKFYAYFSIVSKLNLHDDWILYHG